MFVEVRTIRTMFFMLFTLTRRRFGCAFTSKAVRSENGIRFQGFEIWKWCTLPEFSDPTIHGFQIRE